MSLGFAGGAEEEAAVVTAAWLSQLTQRCARMLVRDIRGTVVGSFSICQSLPTMDCYAWVRESPMGLAAERMRYLTLFDLGKVHAL